MYDFTLFFSDCNQNFADFDEFAEKCDELDNECAIDWDSQDATFYNFSFGFDYRQAFCEKSLNSDKKFVDLAKHEIEVQREFRSMMAAFF